MPATLRNSLALTSLLAVSTLANDQECRRLIDLLPATTFGRGLHSLQLHAPPSQGAQWFLSASGEDPAWVEVDGRVVIAPASLAGHQDRATVRVQLGANSQLNVLVPGRHGRITIRVLGIVPAADLQPNVGTPVGEVQVFDQLLPGGLPAQKTRLVVPAPGQDGLLFLAAERWGQSAVLLSKLLWNDEAVLGPTDFLPHQPPVERPVASRASNTLETWVLGLPGSRLRVRLRGWVTDPAPPTAVWETPPEGAAVDAGTTFRLTWSDVGTGVDPAKTRIMLNGQDVTSAFTMADGSATALLQALPPAAFLAGTNTIAATVKDRACNPFTVERRFSNGEVEDIVPPVIQQPDALVIEQAGPAGTVVTFPLPSATDDRDPAPVVTCTPNSGSLFPPGVTTVVCTARDQAGNVSEPVSFTVTVRDTIAPVLSQPGDILVEQEGPAGTIVSYTQPTAVDAVDPNPLVDCDPPPGLFPGGTTVVTCTATDAAGNTSLPVTFRVRVVDTTPPSIETAPDLVVEQETPAGTVVSFVAPAATDTVDPVVDAVCIPPSGSVFPPGSTVVQCVATDDSGNVSASIFSILVVDRTAPMVTIASPTSGSVGHPSSTLRVTFVDAVATVESTLLVTAQGRDVTGLLTRGDGFAEAPLASLGLDEGRVDVFARIEDAAGNEGSASSSFDYTTPPMAAGLVIEVPPAPSAPLVLGQPYDLTIRAVTAGGDIAATFTGLVVLQTSDPTSLLNGLIVDFAPVHSGVRTLPGLAEFGAEGTHTITASTLEEPVLQGVLTVQVARSERGRVLVVLPSGSYSPGQTVLARVFVDAGPSDGDSTSFQDVLGAYDVRLLFDDRQLEVLRVDAGPSPLGSPMFVLPGSLRLMDLSDLGSLRAPGAPDPDASGLLEVASVDLRVRTNAPSGPVAIAVVGDALTTAAPAADDTFLLSPVGPLGPRVGEVEGQVSVASPWPSAGLHVIGFLPRAGEGLVAGPQTVIDPRVLLTAPVDPTTLGNVTLTSGGVAVAGVARLGDSAYEVRFTPDAPLAPGEYTLVVGSGLAAMGGGQLGMPRQSSFVVGPVSAPRPADLDQDGEIAVLDLQVRRDVLLGRTAGAVPDFPPLFLRGAPGTVQVPRVGDTAHGLEVVDPQGGPVSMATDNLPSFAQLERTGADTFKLTVTGTADGGAIDLTATSASGETTVALLKVVPERDNAAPTLRVLSAKIFDTPVAEPMRIDEDSPLRLQLVAFDPDLADPVTPDHVTFLSSSYPNVSPPSISGPFGEVAEYVFRPDFEQAGDHELEFRVRDDSGAEGVLVVRVTVTNMNRRPTFTSVAPVGTASHLPDLRPMTFTWTAVDPDGGPVELILAETPSHPDILSFTTSSSPGQLTVTVTPRTPHERSGRLELTAVASDGESLSFDTRFYQWPAPAPTLLNPLTIAPQTSNPTHGFPSNLVALGLGRSGWIQLFGLPTDALIDGQPASMSLVGVSGSVTYTHADRMFQFDLAAPLALGAPPQEVILEVVDKNGKVYQTGLLFVHDGGLESEPDVPDPELVSVSDTSLPLVLVRLRVHRAQRVHSFFVGGMSGLSLAVGLPGASIPQPLGTVDYDLLIGRPLSAGTLQVAVNYRNAAADPGHTTSRLPFPPIEIALQEASRPFPTTVVRHRSDGGLEELPRYDGLSVMPILPEGSDPLTQSIGPENPYVMFLVLPSTPSPLPQEEPTTAPVSVTPLEGLETLVPVSDSALGPVHFQGRTDTASDYRISPPIFLAFGHRPPGTLSPIEVLPDRIVVSIAGTGYPGAGPMSDETGGYNATVMVGNVTVEPFVPGLALRTPPSYPILVASSRPLDGAGAWCSDVVAGFDPYMRRSEVRAEKPEESGEYFVLDGENGAHPAELDFPVHDFIDTNPGFVPGANRVRMDGPSGQTLFEATFDLLVGSRSIAAKTAYELTVDFTCDGARPGDPAQEAYLQADLPLDDGDGPGTSKAGAMVLLATGEEILERTDLVIPGRAGMDFKLVRRYRSQIHWDGPVGYAWDLNWHESLHIERSGGEIAKVARQNGGGRITVWVKDPHAPRRFIAPVGYFGILLHEPEGRWLVLREPNGFKRFYSDFDGLLRRVEDRCGNSMQVYYGEAFEGQRQISHITDVFGREIRFRYETMMSAKNEHKLKRLVEVTDFLNRSVEYVYDANGDLVAARTPILTGETPDRRTERYTYYSGFPYDHPFQIGRSQEELNHNLKTVTSPQEVFGGPDEPTLQFTYGTDIDDELTFDKVISETVGGQNASGVQAGGTRVFTYSRDIDLGLGTDLLVKVKEPNGVEHHHLINRTSRLEHGLREVVTTPEPAVYETRTFYNQDGLVTLRFHPSLMVERFYYAEGGRDTQRNLIRHERYADARGAAQSMLVTEYTYEPIYNQLASITDSRGFAPEFLPPNGESTSPARYTTRFIYDYQEASAQSEMPEASRFGLNSTAIYRYGGFEPLEYFGDDLNGDSRTQRSGNLIRIIAPPVTLDPGTNEAQRIGSTRQDVITDFWWNDGGQQIASFDPVGIVTVYRYYSADGPGGTGETVPAFSTSPGGYLAARIVDAALSSPRRAQTPMPLSLTTRYACDDVGNVTAIINPRGVRTEIQFNAVNEIVKVTRGVDSGTTGEFPLRFVTTQRHDANGRVVEIVTGLSEGFTPSSVVRRTLAYDILGCVVRSTVEGPGIPTLTTQYAYDAVGNRTRVVTPEGNVTETLFDGRNLPYSITRGAGTSDASTVTLVYDANKNVTHMIDAEDSDGSGGPETTAYDYDGYDRLRRIIDQLGNVTELTLDPCGQVVKRVITGHPPGDLGGGAIRLAEARFDRDELKRLYRVNEALFGDSIGAVPPVVTRREFDAASRSTFTVEDDGQVTTTLYDGASRPIEIRDALGNRSSFTYDANGNVIEAVSHEVAPSGLLDKRSYRNVSRYDQLDRLIQTIDSAGQTWAYGYDARDNLILENDPEGPLKNDPALGTINQLGNTILRTYDALNRLRSELRVLRHGGIGPGDGDAPGGTNPGAIDQTNPHNPDGVITVSYAYDGDSRLTAITDDNGRVTSFEYDHLDRRVKQTLADGAVYTATYDRDGNLKTTTDPNGSTITRTYDALHRLVSLVVSPGAGVVGTTRQTFAYDGLSRLVASSDDNGTETLQVCGWTYDSLGRVLTESQNGAVVRSSWSGDGRRLTVSYPGGRLIRSSYDAVDRVSALLEGTTIASNDWVGPGQRLLRRHLANGTELRFSSLGIDFGYDEVKRIRRLTWRRADSDFVDRSYSYNRASYRISERRDDEGGVTDRFTHDSAYRITRTTYDQPLREVSYLLDGVGNRRTVETAAPPESPAVQAYDVNLVNEYTAIDGSARAYDRNGNLTDDGTRRFYYDAFDRLVQVVLKGATAAEDRPIALYRYLADGRRARTVAWDPATGAVVREASFVHDGPREIEERNSAGQTVATYVWAPEYVDALIQFERTSFHPKGAGTFFVHQDARFNVVAVTDSDGAVVERRRFDDFGAMEVRDSAGQVVPQSTVGLDYGFQGRRHDPETGLIYFRARYYDPATGRFMSRDPVWDPGNVGNQYTFVGNSPISGMDPTGEIAFLPALGLLGLGIFGGMEVTGWGAAGYTGDPGLEVAPSQMAYHALTGSSVFGGSRGFEQLSYSGGERVYQGAIAAASFLGGGIAGATARGASVPGWLLGVDAALNVGLGGVETYRGHTIMGPLQIGLGLVGLAGLRGPRGAVPDDPLLDNNILAALHQGDAQAVAFARRNRGLLSTIREVRDEFLDPRHGRTMLDWQRLAGRYHIRLLESPTTAEVEAVMRAAGVNSPRYLRADAPLVAAAVKHGVGVASGNYDVLRLALRNNLAQNRILFRSFNDPSQAVRIANYQRARRIVQNDPRGLNPWAITGSSVGR